MLDMLTVVTPMRNEEETAELFMQRLLPALERNSSKWKLMQKPSKKETNQAQY